MSKHIKLIYSHFSKPPKNINHLINQEVNLDNKNNLYFNDQSLDIELIKTFFIPNGLTWDEILKEKENSTKTIKKKEPAKETEEVINKED